MIGLLRPRPLLMLVTFALLCANAAAQTRARSIAVLEYRAGTHSAAGVAEAMARELARLTPHQVLSTRDARRRFGSHLDAAVARCQGEPACVANIGQRLGAREVLLVGVSQLGDVILAIQRIKVPSGEVLGRVADSLSRRGRVPPALLRRYLRRLLPPEEFKRYGKIIVRTEALGDRVLVDEIDRGKTPIAPLTVPAPGRYTVRVQRPGHRDFVARLDVLPEATVAVKPNLSPVGHKPSWYEKWWVWALVGGVVAGSATALAIGLADSPSEAPAVLVWPR